MMRMLARPLVRWLNVTRFGLGPDWQYEAEFPAASAHRFELTSRSSRAAGRASPDALRPINHQKFINDKHEILHNRKVAPWARTFPSPKWRCPGASIRRKTGAKEKRILVHNCG